MLFDSPRRGSVDPERRIDFSRLKISDIEVSEIVSRIAREREKRQAECAHEGAIRFGPSAVQMPLGNWRDSDGYVCRDCGYQSKRPIGRYLQRD